MAYIWIRCRRSPLFAVAVFLFSGLIATVLCSLQRGIVSARRNYEEIYRQIEVVCTITSLTGEQSNYLNIPPQVHTLFTEGAESGSAGLADLVKDVQMRGSLQFIWDGKEYTLAGITALRADSGLWPENGCTVFWREGTGDSFFDGSNFKCLIPEELEKELKDKQFPEDFFAVHIEAENSWERDYDAELEIAGTYAGKTGNTIYCSWETYRKICGSALRPVMASSLCATLKDNGELEKLRERAKQWFAVPDVRLAGMGESEGHYLALDINDMQLENAQQNLKNSMAVNRIAAAVMFVLSAGSGALVGFLIIRSRKHEIALLRTLGTTNWGIYGSYVLEQAFCVILGIAAGGAVFRWQPWYQLCLFAGIYLAGLSVMLWIYLRKNLLIVMKEDE